MSENVVGFNFWFFLSFLSGLYVSRRVYLYNKKNPEILNKVIAFFKKLFKKEKRIEGNGVDNHISKQ